MFDKGKKNDALWLIIAVAFGLFAYSIVGITVNGFQTHMIFPLLMGAINLISYVMLKA